MIAEEYRGIDEIKADVALVRKYENMTGQEAARGMPADHYFKYWVDGRPFIAELRAALTASIPLDRLEAICQAEREGRCVVLPCKKEPFDCRHCKHLHPSDKTNRLFCSYHSEGEHQYEVLCDDYCSDFERAAAEAARGEDS